MRLHSIRTLIHAEAALPAADVTLGCTDEWRSVRSCAHEFALLSRLLLPAAAGTSAAPSRVRVDAPLMLSADAFDRFRARRSPPRAVAEWETGEPQSLYLSALLSSAESVCVSVEATRCE